MMGRVIPFWDLYVHELSLVALWEEGTQSLQPGSTNQTLHEHFQERHDDEYCICNNGAYILHRKAYEVIGEMSELMVENQLKYGFLTTWNLCRDSRDPSVCQVLARLLLVAMNDFELDVTSTVPVETNIKKRKRGDSGSIPSSEIDMTPLANVSDSRTYHDLCQKFSVYMREISSDPNRLSDFMSSLQRVFLGYGRIGNTFKTTVDMGGDRHLEVVLKVAEKSKLKKELALEAYVYKKLSRFQGKCIPFLFVDVPICFCTCFNSTCLIMSYEGTTMDKVDVTSIPLSVRERAWDDNVKIKNAGVEKLNFRKQDVCWNAQHQRIVHIDFGVVYLRDEKRRIPEDRMFAEDARSLYYILHLPRCA
ncbi:hypothetical protein LEN26_005113 [Aphanomyces euteiches]|nr:hypothetical protein LEN26_005113 [Aphanomyces euteiches]